MPEKNVPLHPASGIQVKVKPDVGLVVVHVPYWTDFNTEKQELHDDHAYALLEEQALELRNSLNEALRRIAAAKK